MAEITESLRRASLSGGHCSADVVELLNQALRTGTCRRDDAGVSFRRWHDDWYRVLDKPRVFCLRILGSVTCAIAAPV